MKIYVWIGIVTLVINILDIFVVDIPYANGNCMSLFFSVMSIILGCMW